MAIKETTIPEAESEGGAGAVQDQKQIPEEKLFSPEGDAGKPDADESKKDDQDKGEDGKPEDAESGKDGAPESYQGFDLPEGFDVDEAALTSFQEMAKDIGLDQGKAQKVVDLYTKMSAETQEQQLSAWKKTVDDWATDTKADKEIGGDRFNENLGVAKRALDQFGSAELNQALVTSGMGNHPEFIRFAMKVGRGMTEDKMTHSGGGGTGEKSRAKTLFPNMN